MEEAGDHLDPVLPQPVEPLVMPAEIELARNFRRDPLPQDRIADRLDAKLGHGVDVRETGGVARLDDLVPIYVTDAGYGAFHPTPKFQWRGATQTPRRGLSVLH